MSKQEQAPWKAATVTEVTPATEVPEVTISDASDLITVEPQEVGVAVTSAGRFSSNRADIRQEDIFIPKLRLAQGQTPEVLSREAQPGQWVLMGADASDECEVVVLSMARVRELRTPGQGEDGGKMLCHAPDAEQGIGDPGIRCDDCALKDWREGATVKERQPLCAELYRYRVFDVTHGQLAMLQFQRTSLNVAKTINTFIMQRDYGNFLVKLGSQKRESGEGRNKFTFYVPTAVARPIDEDTRQMAAMLI